MGIMHLGPKRSHVCTEGVNHFINIKAFCDQKRACFLQCREREVVGCQGSGGLAAHARLFSDLVPPPRGFAMHMLDLDLMRHMPDWRPPAGSEATTRLV